jgi:hypothetical protein
LLSRTSFHQCRYPPGCLYFHYAKHLGQRLFFRPTDIQPRTCRWFEEICTNSQLRSRVYCWRFCNPTRCEAGCSSKDLRSIQFGILITISTLLQVFR